MDPNEDEERANFDVTNSILVGPAEPSGSGTPKSPTKSLQFFMDLYDYFSPPTSPSADRRESMDSIDFFGPGALPALVADEHLAIISTFSSVHEEDLDRFNKHRRRTISFSLSSDTPADVSALPADDPTLSPSASTTHKSFSAIEFPTAHTACGKPFAAQLTRATSKQSSTAQQRGWQRSLGPLLALAAAFVMSISSVASKFLLDSFTTPQIGVFRFASLCIITTPFMLHKRVNPFSPSLLRQFGLLLVLRMSIGSSAFLCRIFAFSKLPLGDATTIMFMSPVFVGLFARILLHEKYRKIFLFSALAAIAGCALITRPQFLGFFPVTAHFNVSSADRLTGSLVAVASAMSNAMIVVVLRQLRKVPAQVVIFYFGLGGTLISIVLCVSTSTPIVIPTALMHWVWIVVLALASNLGQWLFTSSLHYENANVISLFRASDVVWAFAAQVLIFGQVPHWMSICGAVLVCSGVALLAVYKILESFRNDFGGDKDNRRWWLRPQILRSLHCCCCEQQQKSLTDEKEAF